MATKTAKGKFKEILEMYEGKDDLIERFQDTLDSVYRKHKNNGLVRALINAGDASQKLAFQRREENIEKRWSKEVDKRRFITQSGGYNFIEQEPQYKRIHGGSAFIACGLYDLVNNNEKIDSFLSEYFSEDTLKDPTIMGSYYTGRFSVNVGIVMSFLAAGEVGRLHGTRVANALRKLRRNSGRMRMVENPDDIMEDAQRIEKYVKTGQMDDRNHLYIEASWPVILPLLWKSPRGYKRLNKNGSYDCEHEEHVIKSRSDYILKKGFNPRYVMPWTKSFVNHAQKVRGFKTPKLI